MKQHDLTTRQKDYAIFLPAISSFFATYIGKQRHDSNYIPQSRMPGQTTMENLNWLNAQESLFPYRWSLYSAGHADIDVTKDSPKEDMIRNRDTNSFLLGDSGGFQIAKGVWEGDWANPTCPKAMKKRTQLLQWMDKYMDYGMVLDVPAWAYKLEKSRDKTGIRSYNDALKATFINNDYFMKHRTGACKFLNVLQGENHADADHWYAQMKDYSDPKKYPGTHFNGWAMGGQNMCDIHLVLKRLVILRHDGLLEKGIHDWMHFLGTSKLEWATLLTDVQRAIRKYHNPNFTISFDCASPFLATANGQIYIDLETDDRKKWVYRMQATADNKKYSSDSRSFRDAVLQDGIHPTFLDSPVSQQMKISDVCHYGPGDLNKLGKEGKTSWDSFSYALMMCHNVWQHINAVQTANEQYDSGKYPKMLIQETFNKVAFRDIVEAIFATDNKDESLAIIEEFSRFWMSIIGTRGATGKKTVNASTSFGNLFEEA